MSMHMFYERCDRPGCMNRSAEYGGLDSCDECMDALCPQHIAEGCCDSVPAKLKPINDEPDYGGYSSGEFAHMQSEARRLK